MVATASLPFITRLVSPPTFLLPSPVLCPLSLSLSLFLPKYFSHKERVAGEAMGDGRFMGEGSAGLILLSLAREQAREGGREGRERGEEKRCVPYVEEEA